MALSCTPIRTSMSMATVIPTMLCQEASHTGEHGTSDHAHVTYRTGSDLMLFAVVGCNVRRDEKTPHHSL